MKNFLYKIFLFVFFLLAFLVITGIFFPDAILKSEIISVVEEKILNLEIDSSNVNIIIAGDSRAERQLIPKMIESVTGLNTINISNSSCDLVTAQDLIEKYYSNGKFIFVISASSWQINDGSIIPGYLSDKCFEKLTFMEKRRIYKNNVPELFRLYVNMARNNIKTLIPKKVVRSRSAKSIPEYGYVGFDGNITYMKSSFDIEQYFNRHGWYKDCKLDGARLRVFKDALKKISKMKYHFIIYQPPVSPYWKRITKNTFIDSAEIEYSGKLKKLVSQYDNIDFYDFYLQEDIELNDSMYYEYQHLNRKGSKVFSNKIAEIIKKYILTSKAN